MLLVTGPAAAHRNSRGLELLGDQSLAQANVEATAAEPVERGDASREHDRRVEQRIEHAGAQADPARPRRDVAECLQRVIDAGVQRRQRRLGQPMPR